MTNKAAVMQPCFFVPIDSRMSTEIKRRPESKPPLGMLEAV